MESYITRTSFTHALLGAILLMLLIMPNMVGQSDTNGTVQQPFAPVPIDPNAHPAFEVATIKPSTSNEPNGNFRIGDHRIYIENQTVNRLITFAYSIHEQQLIDGPAWFSTLRYDIVGQADIDGSPNLQQIQEMLRKLLAERFQLKCHREKRELSIYAITLSKNGPKFLKNEENPNALPGQTGSRNDGRQLRRFTNNTMSDFALGMQDFLDRPAVDRTGLTGRYDFALEWTPEDLAANGANPGPSLFTAIQEQLGLKLERVKGPADVLVVDSVAKPSEN